MNLYNTVILGLLTPPILTFLGKTKSLLLAFIAAQCLAVSTPVGVTWSVCLCVGYDREPCKNGRTDRDSVEGACTKNRVSRVDEI